MSKKQELYARINAAEEHVYNLARDAEFRPDWTNRRKIVFLALGICGTVIVLIASVSLFVMVHAQVTATKVNIDEQLVQLMKTLIWALIFFAAAIIGTYIFAVNADTQSFRDAMTKLAGILKSPAEFTSNGFTNGHVKVKSNGKHKVK